MKKAVIDRIVDGKHAVLLVGEDEIEKIIPINDLPSEIKEGDWLVMDDDGSLALDQAETEKVKSRIRDKMAFLRNKQGSKFKKN